MAFKELMGSLKLPKGASERYRKLEALGRMLDGTLYDDLAYSFEEEKHSNKHIPLRERRPSVDLNLAYEVTQDTCADLFGDEQFPIIHVLTDRTRNEDATTEMVALVEAVGLQDAMVEAYEEGVVGSVGVVIHKQPNGLPYYEVLPGKFCQPIYRNDYSNELLSLVVTYPLPRKVVEKRWPEIANEDKNRLEETFWYRYIVGPQVFIDYFPLSDADFADLGKKDGAGNTIEFHEQARRGHGFDALTPAAYARNFGGRGRDADGVALWWPIRNICVELDYTLSQAGRGLRYAADPMLFVRRGDMNLDEGLYDAPAAGMATLVGPEGDMVRGVTQVLEGEGKDADAKLLEISAAGIKEEREFASDLREFALEVIGGMRARSSDQRGPTTGRAIDKANKPLRRLVRRQRRPYGRGLLVKLVNLTVYGFEKGVFESPDLDVTQIPVGSAFLPEWPTEDMLQGADLKDHIDGLQALAGGSPAAPVQLIDPAAVGRRAAEDVGLQEPYESIKGDLKPAVVPGAKPAGSSSK